MANSTSQTQRNKPLPILSPMDDLLSFLYKRSCTNVMWCVVEEKVSKNQQSIA